MRFRKSIAIGAAASLISLIVSGCGSINSWMAEKTADTVPHWMGGLPDDAPPRPDDPRYRSYIAGQMAKTGQGTKDDASK